MAEAGIGHALIARLGHPLHSDPDQLSELLDHIGDALEQSPAPEQEWRILQHVLGLDMLARLLNISHSSARRYLSGSRATPDTVTNRLHFLALLVGDLSGAYNDIGVRRWFERRRERLDGNTPAQALGAQWSPDDAGPRSVQSLASALRTSPVT